MQPFDIYQAAYNWNNCADARPWLLIDVRANGVVACFPISSACYTGDCFEIRSSHPDFAATGLTKSCFVHDLHLFELPATAFTRLRGRLSAELLKEFRDYAGV